jgi:hypothetical protein
MPSDNQGQRWLGQIQAGVEASQAATNRPHGMPPLSEVKIEATRMGLSQLDAEAIFDCWLTNGFRTKTGRIRDWRAAMRTWKREGWFPSQKQAKALGGFNPPLESELIEYCRSKKMTTTHALRIWRLLVANGWRYYGNAITNDAQWQAICHSHQFNDR